MGISALYTHLYVGLVTATLVIPVVKSKFPRSAGSIEILIGTKMYISIILVLKTTFKDLLKCYFFSS